MIKPQIILAALLKAVAAAPEAQWPTGLRHFVQAMRRRHGARMGPKVQCSDDEEVEEFTNCDWIPKLGAGCCPKHDLETVRQAVRGGHVPVTQAIRDLSPQPMLPVPDPQSSARLFSLRYGAPPAHWKAVDAGGHGLLYVIDDFLTPSEADGLVDYAEHRGRPHASTMYCGAARHCEFRRSKQWALFSDRAEQIVPRFAARVAQVANANALPEGEGFSEMPTITKYQSGEFYSDHNDAEPCHLQVRKMSDATKIRETGETCEDKERRSTTVLIYLNDVTDGGGSTYFPRLDARVAPKRGSAIVFHPTYRNGWTDPLMLHGAMEAKGNKYVIQQWLHAGETQAP